MRSAKQLIEDLKAQALALGLEGKGSFPVQLIVQFGNIRELIRHDDPDALNKLNDCIRRGGEPCAIMAGAKTTYGTVSFEIKPLPEYEWVAEYLAGAGPTDSFAAGLKKRHDRQ